MFLGEYNHTIDKKGRLIIPTKLRNLLGDSFVMTKNLDGCVAIYDKESFDIFAEKVKALPYSDSNARDIKRFLLGGVQELVPDKMGRVLVTADLRKAAGLINDVKFIGVGDHIEVWDLETYNKKNNFSDSDELARKMEGLGI